MIIRWPDTLPCPQFGLTYSLGDPQLRPPLDDGYGIYRRRFTGVPVDFSVRFLMKPNQADEFEEFYRSRLDYGSLWFVMQLVTTHKTGDYYVRFSSPYSCVKLGPNTWEYTAEMQIYLRPSSRHMPPTVDAGPFYLLNEDGSYRLLEDGTRLMLE